MIHPAALSHVPFIALKEEEMLDLRHLEFVVFLSSGGPAFQLLVLGMAIYFERTRLLYCLISDSGPDITAVYLGIQGLVIYFSSCKSLSPELCRQFLQTLYQGSVVTADCSNSIVFLKKKKKKKTQKTNPQKPHIFFLGGSEKNKETKIY